MITTMSIDEVQAKLAEVIARLAPGEEIVITENQQPVAKLVSQKPVTRKRRVPGLGRVRKYTGQAVGHDLGRIS